MLVRFDPFRELDALDRLAQAAWGTGRSSMPMDAYRHGDNFFVHFDLPGIDPSTIAVTVEQNALTVTAERRWQPAEDVEVLASERPQGSFSRQLLLGEGLDLDSVEASYDLGVLTLRIPVAEQAKPRKVSVAHGKREAIEVGEQAA